MKTSNSIPIDGMKMKRFILSKGYISDVAIDLGYSQSALSHALNSGMISRPLMTALELKYGIKYSDYKPRPEQEPQADEPVPVAVATCPEKPSETKVVSKDDATVRTLLSMIAALNNNLTAIHQALEIIDSDIKSIKEDDAWK